MSDTFQYVMGKKYKLAGSGCTSTATSITLQSFKLPDDSTTISMTDFGTISYGVLEPKTSNVEIISFTGVTQNADGTATLTGVTRGLKFNADYSSSASLKLAHAGGAIFIISNPPQFYDKLSGKDNDETYTGTNTYTTLPRSSSSTTLATDAAQFITKYHFDTNGGNTSNFNRIVIAGTAGETVAAGNLVYLKSSDAKWYLCDADTASTVENVILGIAQGAGTTGNSISNGVLLSGLDSNQSGLTAATKYYASNTAGALSSSAGTTEVSIGFTPPGSTTTLIFMPRFDQQLTEDQQDALVGTSGTPSSSNKYVTDADTSATASGSKIVRGTAGKIATGWIDTGTGANQIVQLDSSSRLPAVSGALLTNVNTTTNGVTSRAGDTASGSQTIAHGLGRTPKTVRIQVTSSSGGTTFSTCRGTYNGSSASCIYSYITGGNWLSDTASQIIFLPLYNLGTTYQAATIAVDATNITLTWTRTGSTSSDSMKIQWEAEG